MIRAETEKRWQAAIDAYAELVRTHSNAAYHNRASEFHYRQEVCNRKLVGETTIANWNVLRTEFPRIQLSSLRRLLLGIFDWFTFALFEVALGYFEKPARVVYSALSIIILSSFMYYDWKGIDLSVGGFERFGIQALEALYFSAVSFTALGYGGWVTQPDGWNRYLGVLESVVGVAFLAILVLTVSRRFIK